MDIKPKAAMLPFYLIDDGHIIYSSLRTLGKDEDWLYKKLSLKTKKDLKKMILAIYDKEKDKIELSFKEQC